MKIIKLLKYAALTLSVILLAFLISRFLGLDVPDVLEYLPESPWLAAIVLLSLFCLKSVVFVIPLAVLYISAGIMFPIELALALSCAGLFIEMTIGYFIGRRLSGDRVAALLAKSKRAEQYLSRQGNTNSSMCFVARLLPLPFDFVNMFFGASSISYPKYVALTFLGLAPKMIPYVFMGDAITSPLSIEFIVPFIIGSAVSIGAYILYRLWHRHRLATEGGNDQHTACNRND